ncbi:laminin subunit beta-2-like, partial [Eucyclogobius newberryi]|uniref:laminin subunit beta-2-like n=1 Tax=Eucyclogobius newberryi TaxID=166745 RepID=UPI003B5B24DC
SSPSECGCHPLGSESPQCDRSSGACLCREGVTGPRCDGCARGYSGVFPSCQPCHACFALWDDLLCQLKRDLEHLLLTAENVLEGGVAGGAALANHSRVNELWRRIAQVQALVTGNETERAHQLIAQSIDDIRAEIAVADGRLMAIGADLNISSSQEASVRQRLGDLEEELKNLNQTLSLKQQLLHDLLTSGFSDQFEKIKRFHKQSLKAEEKCNASVSGSLSPVEQSRGTRNRTKNLLDSERDRLLRTISAQNRSLSELKEKTQNLEERERRLSVKVCGGAGQNQQNQQNQTCPEVPCGGAGCRDAAGTAVCGGDGCNGTVSASKSAVNHARNVSRSLNAANDELQDVARKLQDLVSLTLQVKKRVMSTLHQAQSKKDLLQDSNQKLKDFIRKIKDFLTEEGADPESIQKVALQVLLVSLPVNRTILDFTVSQIKVSLSNVTNVEQIVNQTSENIERARSLLRRAQDARTRAEGVKDATNQTKAALDVSQNAINEATAAQRQAEKNLNHARNAMAQVDQHLSNLEQKQMDLMLRLSNLSVGVEMLRNKTRLNQDLAKEAAALSIRAQDQASDLVSSLNETERQFQDLRQKLDSFGGESGGLDVLSKRAKDLKNEAEGLLDQATQGVELLKKLEKKFRSNEQKLQRQRSELDQLRGNVTFVRDEIRNQVQKYSNCN